MNSSYIKTALTAYLRFKQGAKLVATEAGYYSADVLAVRKNDLIEVEVKTSKSDMKADFRKPKHRTYQAKGLTESQAKYVPSTFYFAVPEELAEFAMLQCLNTPYGVLVISGERGTRTFNTWCHNEERKQKVLDAIKENDDKLISIEPATGGYHKEGACYVKYVGKDNLAWEERVKVIKRAKKLHAYQASKESIHSINARASSELASLRVKNHLMTIKLAKDN